MAVSTASGGKSTGFSASLAMSAKIILKGNDISIGRISSVLYIVDRMINVWLVYLRSDALICVAKERCLF